MKKIIWAGAALMAAVSLGWGQLPVAPPDGAAVTLTNNGAGIYTQVLLTNVFGQLPVSVTFYNVGPGPAAIKHTVTNLVGEYYLPAGASLSFGAATITTSNWWGRATSTTNAVVWPVRERRK